MRRWHVHWYRHVGPVRGPYRSRGWGVVGTRRCYCRCGRSRDMESYATADDLRAARARASDTAHPPPPPGRGGASRRDTP